MRKFTFVCLVLLTAAALSAPAHAQTCLKYVSFCDGIELYGSSGGHINAAWYLYDCSNSTTMDGIIKKDGILNACTGGKGDALIRCTFANGCDVAPLSGSEWGFVLDDPLDGTLDMNSGPYGYHQTCWIDDLAYTVQIGHCSAPRAPIGQRSQEQQHSSIE